MKIIDVIDTITVMVEFQDYYKHVRSALYQNFKKGGVQNPYDITVYGVGYLGVGKYNAGENATHTKAYRYWNVLLERCYDPKYHKDHPRYKDCTVCEEWKCFQNFAEWFYSNYYDIGEGRMHLDKDIICHGNKEYRPDKCIFVPQRINLIFMSKRRKNNLPTGIYLSNNKQKYHVSYGGIPQGTYSTLEEAAAVHTREKLKHIKNVAEEYKDRIPEKVYNTLVNYKI